MRDRGAEPYPSCTCPEFGACDQCPEEPPTYEQALRDIADADPVDLILDPGWSQRIAQAALAEAA